MAHKPSPAAVATASGAAGKVACESAEPTADAEQRKVPEPTDAKRMMALFAGHGGAYGTHATPTQAPGSLKWEIKRTARTHRGPTTARMWEDHLSGVKPLGIIPIREDDTCGWACIDVDAYDVDLLPIVAAIEAAGLPLVCARSKSGGLRVYLFLLEPMPAERVRAVMQHLAARLGLADCEIFPKQTALVGERGDLGNWMVMPYFGGTFDGRIRLQVGLRSDGGEMGLGEFLDLCEARRLSPEQFAALAPAATWRQVATPAPTPRQAAAAGGLLDLTDGPVCVERIAAAGLGEHEGRNSALTHAGIFFKRKYPDWKDRVDQYNQVVMRPPLPSEEVTGIIRSLSKKNYEYMCKVAPMCGLCDSKLCRTRAFGVGGGDLPTIASWTVTESDEPTWTMTLTGIEGEMVFTDVRDITNWTRFNDQCVQQLRRFFPVSSEARRRWGEQIADRAPSIETIKLTSGDITPADQFAELLTDMLTAHWQGEYIEDVIRGKPFEDQTHGVYYFKLADIMRYLEHHADGGLRKAKRQQVCKWLRDLGARPGEFGKDPAKGMWIKNKQYRVWHIKSAPLRARADGELPLPKAKGGGPV